MGPASGTKISAAVMARLVLVAAAFFLAAPAAGEDDGWWQGLKSRLEQEGPLPAAEEVYEKAESFYKGRETLYGELVRKTWGRDSWAYRKLPGVKSKNALKAKELFQKVVDNYPFSRFSAPSELRIADCHYRLDEYEEAAVLYRQYIKMHPRSEEVPYAIYKEAMCHYERMRKPSRDQDHTMQAEVIFMELMETHPESEYAKKAGQKLAEVRKGLCEHELLVAEFYFDNREYWAAAARYKGVYQTYPDLGFDAEALYMEGVCYKSLGKRRMAKSRYETLMRSFPESDYAKKAEERLKAIKEGER